jgi:hypothetical protein
MSSKINISQIAIDHLFTLRNESTGKISLSDLLVFFALPALAGSICFYFRWTFTDNAINLVITGMSIFAGLMINVLVLIYTVALNTHPVNVTVEEASLEKRFLREIFANISFSIGTSVTIVVVLAVAFFSASVAQRALSAFAVFLLCNFLLTLLMALKRLHILLSKRFA